MRSVSIFGLAVLFGSLALSGQSPAVSQAQLSPDRPLPSAGTCPLGMQVRQGTGGQLMQVKDGQRTKVFGARLLLTLTGPRQVEYRQKLPAMANSIGIREAVVTVHGWNGKGRVLPVRSGLKPSGQDTSWEMTRTLNVRFASPNEKEVSGEILVSGLTSWTSVDLNSVTYVNGETWTFSGSESCTAVPDPIMLISAR